MSKSLTTLQFRRYMARCDEGPGKEAVRKKRRALMRKLRRKAA